MQEQLEKMLKLKLDREIARRIPSFKLSDARHPDTFLLESPPLTFFIHLSISESKDSFTIEIASNATQSYPWTAIPALAKDIDSIPGKDVWRLRISTLWGAVREQWWTLGPELTRNSVVDRIETRATSDSQDFELKVADIEPKLKDAVEKICRYAVPFFERSAKLHGCALHILITT